MQTAWIWTNLDVWRDASRLTLCLTEPQDRNKSRFSGVATLTTALMTNAG